MKNIRQAINNSLSGIFTYRSVLNGNVPIEIPNLRDSVRNVMISNVSSGGLHTINIACYLTDSVITNVIYRGLSPNGIKHGRPGCASVSNYVHSCYREQV